MARRWTSVNADVYADCDEAISPGPMTEPSLLSQVRVVQATQLDRSGGRHTKPALERLLKSVVWSAGALLCLLVWFAVYLAAGGPLPS